MAERERWRQLRVLIDRGRTGEKAWVTVVFRSQDGRLALDKRLLSLEVSLRPQATSREAVAEALRAALSELLGEEHVRDLP